MPKNSYGFSTEKAKIFKRRKSIQSSGKSSTDIVFNILKKTDPGFTKVLALQKNKK